MRVLKKRLNYFCHFRSGIRNMNSSSKYSDLVYCNVFEFCAFIFPWYAGTLCEDPWARIQASYLKMYKCIYIMQNYDVSRNVVQRGLYLTPFCRKYGTVPWIQRLVIMIWTLPWMYPMISTQNFGGFLFTPWASKHLRSWWHQSFWHSTQPPVATCCAPQAHSITHKGGSWKPTARLGTFQCKSSCIRSGRGQTISGPDKKDKQSHWERHSPPKKQ